MTKKHAKAIVQNGLTKEQQYWSLNGSFSMLTACMELIRSEEVSSLEEFETHLYEGLQRVHKEIKSLETDILQ